MSSLKTLLALVTLWVMAFGAQAQTTWTVSNNPDVPGQFSNIQTAIDDANVQPGDILLISRSSTQYPTFTLRKRLTLIGEGYNTDDPLKEFAGGKVATFNQMLINSAASGSEIIGLVGRYWDTSGSNVNEIRIRKNRITERLSLGNSTQRDWIIEENVFSSGNSNQGIIDGSASSNILIQNNIFGQRAVIEQFTNGGAIVMHNVFVSPESSKGNAFVNCRTIIASNNIFINRNFDTAIAENTFTTNLVFGVVGSLDLTALGQENFEADPQFENWDMVTKPISDSHSSNLVPQVDLRVMTGSPAEGSASDGENIGLTSVVVPYQRPIIPYITRVRVLNGVVPQSGSLNIQLKVEYPNN